MMHLRPIGRPTWRTLARVIARLLRKIMNVLEASDQDRREAAARLGGGYQPRGPERDQAELGTPPNQGSGALHPVVAPRMRPNTPPPSAKDD